MNLPGLSLVACLLAGILAGARAGEEENLIAILQSNAGAPQKCAACQQLRTVGTAKSVPALSALLAQERVSHAACYALAAMPYAEAGAALRDAMGKTSGLTKAGLIDALGWRGERTAVPLLTPLLSDAEVVIARAAAAALGRLGGKDAGAALLAVMDSAPPGVQLVVLEALLQCAEQLRAAGDGSGASSVYSPLVDNRRQPQIRSAAWRGLALSDPSRRVRLIAEALAGADRPIHMAALKLIRESADAQVIEACVARWESLPADSQLAVLDAHLQLGAAAALPTVRRASGSSHAAVREAAWQAFAGLGDASSIPALAKAAARGEPGERDAARDALSRVRGAGVRDALLKELDSAQEVEKAELLRALGERGDARAASVLLKNAATDAEPVRLAALESLRRLALVDTLMPLLDLAAKSKSDAGRQPVLKALQAVCQATGDKEATSQRVIDSIARFSAAERCQVLPLLGELGTPAALGYVEAASKDKNQELAREAVRVLAQWPNAAPAAHLLGLGREAADATLHALALRGCIDVAEQEPDAAKRLALLRQAMEAARRIDEKKQALAQIGQIPTPEALQAVLPQLETPGLADEAGLAGVSIAEKLAKQNPRLADEVASKVLARSKTADVVKRAWALRSAAKGTGPFLQDWLVCGPYRQADAVGAQAVFTIVFGPEKPGDTAQWKPVARADHVDLSACFPGQESCVAYLKTRIIAPEDVDAALLLGSDDGVKAWLNGAVVHSNNVDRGAVPDQDMAPIKLNKGVNQLMLKVSQGGGGWGVCARIVGRDGLPIPGLKAEAPAP